MVYTPRRTQIRTEEPYFVWAALLLMLTLTLISLDKTTNESVQSITGDATSQVFVIQYKIASCNFTMQPGLNLVSFFCVSLEEPLSTITSTSPQITAIFEYQEGSTDKWKSYNPNLPSYVIQDLEQISRREGYWVNSTQYQQFYLLGALRTPTNISLINGWNLAGYATNRSKPVNESLLSITGNFSEIRTYNSTQQIFISYTPGIGGSLTETENGRGYWINANTTEVWSIDE